MNPKDHPLFKRYALDGEATISTGAVPTPYHIYNGYGVFIGGTADFAAVQELLRRETVSPVQTRSGDTLMGIWVCDFTDASLGPHHELQFSFFVSAGDPGPVGSHPLSLLNLMLTRSDVQMLCHGLWNNSPGVVAYNRELLGLNAQAVRSRIERDPRTMTFTYTDEATNTLILAGRINNPGRLSLRANLELTAQLGIRRLSALSRQPWVKMEILNPVSEVFARNAVAETFAKNETTAIRYFDHFGDSLEFGSTPYQHLRFNPQFVQFMDGFKFVYLAPK